MFCKYSFTNETKDSIGRHPIYCKLNNNDMCPLIRYCSIVGDFINVDNIDKNCTYYIKGEDLINMKNGKYKVLFEKRGYLIVEIDNDNVATVKNTLSEVPKYVELTKVDSSYYIKGFEPKPIIEVTSKTKKVEK